MKNRIISILVCCCLMICIMPLCKANADSITLDMVGAAAYALMQQWGLEWEAVGGTAYGAQDYMMTQIESYVNRNGGSLVNLFGADPIKNVAGKLAIGQLMYNGIKDFVGDFVEREGISDAYVCVAQGSVRGYALGVEMQPPSEIQSAGYYAMYENPNTAGVYATYKVYNGNTVIYTYERSGYGTKPPYWFEISDNDWMRIVTQRYRSGGSFIANQGLNLFAVNDSEIANRYNVGGQNYVEPEYIDDTQEYQGTLSGVTPGTVIDAIVSSIYNKIAANDLDIDGEIVDIAPAPTPAPVPPSPYPQAGTELDAINTNIEQLNDMLQDAFELKNQLDTVINSGNATVDGINDLIGQSQDVIQGINDLTEALEGVGTATDSIAASVEAVESLTESISSAMDIIDTSDASEYKFDLKNLFPFCIPFDVVRLLKSFDNATSNVTAPHLQIPVNFGSVVGVYTFDLDFSPFDPVAALLRQVEFVLFAIGLAIATQKMIKW